MNSKRPSDGRAQNIHKTVLAGEVRRVNPAEDGSHDGYYEITFPPHNVVILVDCIEDFQDWMGSVVSQILGEPVVHTTSHVIVSAPPARPVQSD